MAPAVTVSDALPKLEMYIDGAFVDSWWVERRGVLQSFFPKKGDITPPARADVEAPAVPPCRDSIHILFMRCFDPHGMSLSSSYRCLSERWSALSELHACIGHGRGVLSIRACVHRSTPKFNSSTRPIRSARSRLHRAIPSTENRGFTHHIRRNILAPPRKPEEPGLSPDRDPLGHVSCGSAGRKTGGTARV